MCHVRKGRSIRLPRVHCGGALIGLFVAAVAGGAPPAGTAVDPKQTDRPAALQRLRNDFSFDGVARKHLEVGFDDLKGLAQPLTQRAAIQVKNHPDVVFVHPDMSITLGAPDDAYVLGVALGSPARLPGIYETTRKLHKGYQPIVTSKWHVGAFTLKETAFGVLPADKAVVSGTENQDVMVRVTVTNDSDKPAATSLVLLVGIAGGSQCENLGYSPFRAPVSRWKQEKLKVLDVERSLTVNGRVLLTYRSKVPTPTSFQPELDVAQAQSNDLIHVKNGLRFELRLSPRESRALDFTVADNSRLYPDAERKRMAAASFDKALRKAESCWDDALKPGMKLTTPEPRLNDVYRKLILSCLQNLPKEPNTPWVVPVHCSGYPGGIWCWEFAHVSSALDSLGFHKDMEACLRWFTEHQSGIGKLGDANEGPEGEVTSDVGCFVGTGSARWMNETGSVLWMLGAHYRYSRDAAWLNANKESVLAAWRWIQSQRDTTRLNDAAGKRVTQFGLLPRGRSSDWPGQLYYYCWSDGYTYKGMAEVAAAFRAAAAPDAARLSADVDEYRRCIRDTLGRVTTTDPATGLLFAPDTVAVRPGENANGGIWISDGPRALFDVGILNPVADEKFWRANFDFTRRRWGFLAGLTFHFIPTEGGDLWNVAPDSPFWYLGATDISWHRDFLARGEVEKALLVLYSDLIYGMSDDCYETVERVNTADPNYAPLQPNSSSSGRALSMIRRTVIDEQDAAQGKLWLLRGCPRRWFAPGQSIRLSDAPTVFGKLALRTKCTSNRITVDIDAPTDQAMKQLCVVVRAPTGREAKSATVDGFPAPMEADTVTVQSPGRHVRIVVELGHPVPAR